MNEITKFWTIFTTWVESEDADIEKESAFVCLCPDGSGWIGDGTGAQPIEFDSLYEGRRLLGDLS